jgi:hypothetical protein
MGETAAISMFSPNRRRRRNFVLKGSSDFNRNRIHMDARELPCAISLMAEYGDLFNLIYVKSDGAGRVIGHFTLYNLVSWRIVLAESGGVTNTAIALASNPVTSKWDCDVADRHNVNFGWLDTVDDADVLTRARARLERIARQYIDNARDREFGRIVQDAWKSAASKMKTNRFPPTNLTR